MMRKVLCFTLFVMSVFVIGSPFELHSQEKPSIVTIAGESFYIYTVKAGDTFSSLEKSFGADREAIVRFNPHADGGLKTGQMIKIPVRKTIPTNISQRKLDRMFDQHTVNKGETAYSISKRYGVSVNELIEDNPGMDPSTLSLGQKLNIRTASKGKTDDAQIEREMESYRDVMNEVSDRFTHHLVVKGETLYSLSRTLKVPVEVIHEHNQEALKDGLKVGSVLKIPLSEAQASQLVNQSANPSAQQPPSQHTPETIVATPLVPAQTVMNGDASSFRLKQFDRTAPIRVSLLLPLRSESISNRSFFEFYQGVLLALEDLKKGGISTELDLYNTGKSINEVNTILHTTQIGNSDLIIGPVYDESLAPVSRFAAERGIPLVSPLDRITATANPALFQVSPANEHKNDKLRAELQGDKNVVVITTADNDKEFEKECETFVSSSARRFNYTSGTAASAIEGLLSSDKENILVVLAQKENTIENILALISSVQNKLISTGVRTAPIKVIGTSRWAKFANLEKNLYFKLNLRYIAPYHVDRGNAKVVEFDSRYVSAFNSLPSLYAYRGYDVTRMFVGAINQYGSGLVEKLNDDTFVMLQTPYAFKRSSSRGININGEWPLVCYDSGYTISVK